jgi:hypothetical protein
LEQHPPKLAGQPNHAESQPVGHQDILSRPMSDIQMTLSIGLVRLALGSQRRGCQAQGDFREV